MDSRIGGAHHSSLCAVPGNSRCVVRLYVDHELQQQILEPVAEGDLWRRGKAELLADVVGPVVRAADVTLDKIPRAGLHTHPVGTSLITSTKLISQQTVETSHQFRH